MKTLLVATVIAALAASGALASGAKRPEGQRSDLQNGGRQIKAQIQGKPYGDPARQKALEEATRDETAPPRQSKPASSDGAKATPQ